MALTTMPAATAAISPDSPRTLCARPYSPQTPASTTRFRSSSERKSARLRKTAIKAPPLPPMRTPMPNRASKPPKMKAGSVSPLRIISSTTTARIAPTGSMSTPSPSSKVAILRSTPTCLSSGVTTVGPVTTTSEAYKKAIDQGNSPSQ